MKKLLSVVLTVALVLSFTLIAGCFDKAEKAFYGDWEAEIDLSDSFAEALGDAGDEVAEAFKNAKLATKLNMSFKEDGTFSTEIDEDALVESFKSNKDTFAEYFTAYFEQLLEGSGVSVEDALASQGMSLDSLIDNALDEGVAAMKESLSDTSQSGKFKVDGNKLYLAEDGKDFSDEEYAVLRRSTTAKLNSPSLLALVTTMIRKFLKPPCPGLL